MPQLKIRGILSEEIAKISTELVEKLAPIFNCQEDWIEIECIHSTAVKKGEFVPVYPFIEVAWFDRGQEVQDQAARIITDLIHGLGVKSVDIAFTVFEKRSYYENGEHF